MIVTSIFTLADSNGRVPPPTYIYTSSITWLPYVYLLIINSHILSLSISFLESYIINT